MSAAHTPGPWIVATSNSWRRIVSQGHGGMQSVCEPIKQNDGHPDLYFKNGGADGPDARLIAASPDLLNELINLTARFKAAIVQAGTDEEFAEQAVASARAAIAKALPVTTKDAA